MRIEARLEELGLTLPAPLVPPDNFQLVKLHNGLAYVAGHGPFNGTKLLVKGVIGRDLTLEQGYDAARQTALSILASLTRELGDLDRGYALAPGSRLCALRTGFCSKRGGGQRVQ